MAQRDVSERRKAIYRIGQILIVLGGLSFGSVFVSGALNFGNFDNFKERGRSQALRGVGGMGMMILGAVLCNVGSLGLAGAGVVLDPKRAREDLEPWARMAGGVLKDTLDESGVAIGVSATKEPDFADRLRKLHALHQEGILSDEEYAREKSEALEQN